MKNIVKRGALRMVPLMVATALLVSMAPESAASGEATWADLRTFILETLPEGPARLDLLAAVDAIEYQEVNGTPADILGAYDAFAMTMAQHYVAGHVVEPDGNAILESCQDVSQDQRVKIKRQVKFKLSPLRACMFLDCTIGGVVCVSYMWSYDDGETSGGGMNCLSI